MLIFNVRNQSISRIDNFSPAEKSKNYLEATFNFKTEDWNGATKTAVFENSKSKVIKDVILSDDKCIVPWEVLEENAIIKVSVYGITLGEKITTDTAEVNLNSTLYGGSATAEPTPDVYTQIVNMIENMEGNVSDEQIAKAVSDYLAENPVSTEVSEDQIVEVVSTYIATNKAELKGDKGDKGDTGETGPQGIQGEQGESGQNGSDGKSAYEIAIGNGFKGTEEEWLASLHGKDGVDGSNGVDGKDGADGFSPIVTVEQIANGAVITITDENGTTSATVNNGKDSSDVGNVDSLAGKTIVFLGDSVTQGLGWQNEVGDTTNKYGWAKVLQENHPTATVKNLGISGACLAYTGKYIDIINQYVAMKSSEQTDYYVENPDYIIFSGGGNDYFQSIEKGTICENYAPTYESVTTTIGALEYMFMDAYENYPSARKGFIITHILSTEAEEYYEVVRQVCKKWAIPILDLSQVGEINPIISGVYKTYFSEDDHVHPNQKCYREILAPKVEKWLQNEMI